MSSQMTRPLETSTTWRLPSRVLRPTRHGKLSFGVDDVAVALPDFRDRLNQSLNLDVRDASGTVLLLVLDARGLVVVEPVTRPARHSIWIGVERRRVDPVLSHVLRAAVTQQHDLRRRLERHRPGGTGVWRHH